MARICIVRQNYYPYAMDYHVQRDALTLIHDGHQVDVVCLRGPGQRMSETVDGVKVYRVPVRKTRGGIRRYLFEYGTFFLLTFLLLTFLMVRRRYQAVEVDTMPDALVFSALGPKLMGADVILYLFECMPELFMDTYGVSQNHPMTRLLRVMESRASRFADHVVYCGPGYRAIQEPRAGKQLETSVVLNVPDDALFMPEQVSPPRLREAGEPFRVVTHGSLLEKYGVQTLVEASALLVGRIPNLEVLVAGDGEYRQELEELSRSTGADAVVRFVGMLPAQEIPQFISQADIGVVTIIHG
ncbi:MAG: glycosyltransferase, partial [Chloroflexota bacterium]